MPRIPTIPPEQRNFTVDKARDRLRSAEPYRRDDDTPPKTQGGSEEFRQENVGGGHQRP